MHSFQQYLDNIFQPLFDVTIHPDRDPALDAFLQTVRYVIVLLPAIFPAIAFLVMTAIRTASVDGRVNMW